MSGFDLFKYLRLIASLNPTTIEWTMTDIVYYGKQNEVFKEFAMKHFNPTAVYWRYKSLCKNNYLKYLKAGKSVTHTKYLYAYRGLINAKWISHRKPPPPIIFADAIEGMRTMIPKDILERLHEIIKSKSEGKEKDQITNITEMDDYIETFLKDNTDVPTKKQRPALDLLNKEIRRIL